MYVKLMGMHSLNESIGELVVNGHNGLVFEGADALAAQLQVQAIK